MNAYSVLAAVPLLMAAMSVPGLAADVNASLSALEAYVGNPIVLRVEVANTSSHDAPELPAMDGVDIRSVGTPSRSSQVTIINGRRSEKSSVTYAWELIPRREGAFVIPGIKIKTDGRVQTTRSLRFSATKSQTGDLLFAEIIGDEDQIFVGQPMKVTLRIWLKPYADSRMNVALSEEDMWQMVSQEKSNWGMFADRINELATNNQRPGGEEVLRPDASGTERRYFRYEIEATVYPKRPGQIDGDKVQIVVDYPTRLGKSRDPMAAFFDRGFPSMFRDEMPSMFGPRLTVSDARPIVAGAEVNATEVLPIPTNGRPADYRGAVGHYQIVSQGTPNRVNAGDPITLHLGIQGDGPMDLVQAPPLSQLPELTADFKVSEDALAGVVQDDVKLFTVSIRPRREGVTHIPAIPFSYFDPSTEKFVTVHSEPISISVGAADQLALDAIVGGSAGSRHAASDQSTAPTLNLTNFTGDRLLVSAKPASGWLLTFAVLLPPLTFLATLGFRHRERLKNFRIVSADRDLKMALEAVDHADSPSEISEAVLEFITNRIDATGSSSRTLLHDIERLTNPETTIALDALLRQCEQASYAGLSSQNVAGLAQEAANCLPRLAAMLPTKRQGRNGRVGSSRLTRRAAAKATAAAALIVAGSLLLVGDSVAGAAELSATQQSQILAEADAAYQQAQQVAANDSAESKASFSLAAQKYETLVDDGIVNDHLYFNLGNAYLQSGSLGLAIANYERAIAVNPSSPARQNLDHARSLLNSKAAGAGAIQPSKHIVRTMFNWNSRVPRTVLFTLAAVGWTVVWITASFIPFERASAFGRLLVPAAVITALCVASIAMQLYSHPEHDKAIIVSHKVQLREGNGEGFAQLGIGLDEGTACKVLEQRGDWLKVATSDSTGWVQVKDAALVSTQAITEF